MARRAKDETESDPDWSPDDGRQRSHAESEYDRMERLMRRLLKVPKEAIREKKTKDR